MLQQRELPSATETEALIQRQQMCGNRTKLQAAPEGYVCLLDHALAQREVGVGQVGQSLQQDLRGHVGLEVRRVKLVPAHMSPSVTYELTHIQQLRSTNMKTTKLC